LPADWLLDPTVTEGGDFDWEAVEDLFQPGARRPFAVRARRLGLMRPWELPPGAEVVALQNPLAVLSSSVALAEPAQRRDLLEAAAALTRELLAPVFQFVSHQGLEPRDLGVVAVVSSQTARRAVLLLHKVFRQAGFQHLGVLRRETAAVLALLGTSSSSRNLVVDVEDEALHVHRMLLEQRPGEVVVQTAGSRSLRGLGRSWLVQRLAAALSRAGRLPERTSIAALDRALLGLSGGGYPPEVAGDPPLRITHALLGEVLAQGLVDELAADLDRRLLPEIQDLGGEPAPAVGLGSALAVAEMEQLVVRAAGGRLPASVTRTPSYERCARGVAALLSWLAGDPERRFEIRAAGGLRVDTLRGGSIQLLPATASPEAPGESLVVRQLLCLESDPGAAGGAGQLAIDLLYGCNPDPLYGATLCTLTLDLASPPDGPEIHLALELHLKRSRHGQLCGMASAVLDGARDEQRLRFADDGLARGRPAPTEVARAQAAGLTAVTSTDVQPKENR
jgi:hypothetical protein